jgi:serine/threonine protein kinase
MALTGTIHDFGLDGILHLIAHQRKSGVLVCQSGQDVVRVFFKAGSVVAAESSIRRFHMRLGSLLVDSGLLSEAQLASAMSEQEKTGVRLGEILIQRGLVPREEIARIHRAQVSDTLFQLLRLISGSYQFEPSELAAAEDGAVEPIDTEALLLESLLRERDWPALRSRFRSNAESFRVLRSIEEGEGARSEAAKRAYALIAPGRRLSEILRLTRMSEFETLKGLAELIDAELVAPESQKTVAEESEPDRPEGAVRTSKPASSSAMRVCPRCRLVYGTDFVICGNDGTKLEDETADPLLGRRVDRYLIVQRIGQGSTGRVYRGRHVVLDREYAIKIFYGHALAERGNRERFRREAEAAAKIRHPNIVAVEDFGTSTDGLTFFAMELVQGTSLDELIARGPLSDGRAATIARQIALGLDAAHSLGFVHRDLRPENVMIASRDGEAVVKILDFGLVGLLQADDAPRITEIGQILGQIAYVAPEQARGETPGKAADLYALGVVMYEMLTGKLPFDAADRERALVRKLEAPAPPLSADSKLAPLVKKLLERSISDRPPSGEAVVLEIDRAFGTADLPRVIVEPEPQPAEAAPAEPPIPEPAPRPAAPPPQRAPNYVPVPAQAPLPAIMVPRRQVFARKSFDPIDLSPRRSWAKGLVLLGLFAIGGALLFGNVIGRLGAVSAGANDAGPTPSETAKP